MEIFQAEMPNSILTLHTISFFWDSNFSNILAEVKQGQVGGVKLHPNGSQALISTSCIEHLEFAHDINTDKVLQHKLWSVHKESVHAKILLPFP